ncbi:discoidin domain-containing protein [Paenibacillus aceris]|uniref:F5/8 type C domain-containing protein n=2 Tax=Paenibacillus aceris TaxID=869555 RepID=A0ABS4I331_9BACL|nr:discoidin domain-containing protein [Paenibacillus aceris]MBP1965347.1 hypothetical protein [Paenibacillus aceris]
MLKKCKKITSVALTTAMIVTSMFAFPNNKVEAQQVAGNAPFINSWLVSGPFDSPVVDQIYDTAEAAGSGSGAATIAPKIGDPLSFNNESHKWEYFDDRIYNRNYDDFQDLYGYFKVKKGVDTRNKYVYANTYVYSPVQQQAYFNVGASGSYRLYVNDKRVTAPTTPVEVQKDLTKQAIELKQGWNKLMIQIKHTYTEDVNANNVPIGKDQNVAYLGFYGRVADQSGNKINGLIQSVGGEADTLKIVTQGLSTEDAIATPLPAGSMPVGYKEWPYVWNKSKSGNQYGVAASAFQFMASGGAPDYVWSIVEGKLPGGLELNADGTIATGLVNGNIDLNSSKGIISINTAPGDYTFTVQVTDRNGQTAQKQMTITVKDRPNKWFEEGRVSALTHAFPSYSNFVDPNFSADLWAERAKRQGHSLVSVESLQQLYTWPSKFADPKHPRHVNLPKDENGKLFDTIKPFEQAVKRHGMKFGLYYATEGGGIQHNSTDVFMQNVEDLILRYDPAYLYFDGPQAMKSANYDVMYSIIRDYSDEIIVDSNAWGEEYGDPDLRTAEASGIYANGSANHLVKRTPMEPWKMIRTKDGLSPYYGKRDDFRQVAKEMLSNAGRGYVDNNDQTPIDSRGPYWDSVLDIATRYPKAEQEFIDVREMMSAWFAPSGKPERHESTAGTMPYFLSGYGYEDDGKGNYEKFAYPNSTTGPQWGYATYRDNNIYLHILKGPDSKKGFDAIAGRSLTIGPIKDNVTSVTWLNENSPIPSFTQSGDSLTINLNDVQEDPVDTIIKIVTDSSARKYKLTNVKATGKQLSSSSLQINAEGYMTFPALQVKLSGLTFQSENSGIAVVSPNGIVTPVSNGTTNVTVSGTYEGVTKQDILKVTVRDGKIYVGDNMIGATLTLNGKEAYGEFSTLEGFNYQIEGRSSKGGPIGLVAADIQWHGGLVDLQNVDKNNPVKIKEIDTFTFKQDKIITPYVDQLTKGVVWADITLDGKKFTTNKVFMDLLPNQNLAKTAEVTASHGQDALPGLADGKAIDAIQYDQSKWSVAASEKAWIQYKLPAKTDIANLNINFNSLDQKYVNTPKTINIQTSDDGVQWKDVSTVNGPTGTAYFGFYNQYPINTQAQYVKLSFDGGSNGPTMDLLEVAINGMDKSNLFDRFEQEYKPVNEVTGKFDIKAFTGSGVPIDMKDAVISVTSENQGVITVGDSNLLTAVSKGVAKINIRATIGGRSIEKITYLLVDESGKIVAAPYLSKINLTLNKNTIELNNPIVATFNGLLSTGENADLSRAVVQYVFSDSRLEVVPGSNTIVIKGDLNKSFLATVKANVTLDGVTVETKQMTISALSGNIANTANVSVKSVRGNGDARYVGSKAVDGDKNTSWASSPSDNTKAPWIQLDFATPLTISKVNLIDRGHQVNQIGEGILEWEGGSKKVTNILWNGQPDNIVTFDTPIVTSWIKFTIDPDNKFPNVNGSEQGELGLSEFEVYTPNKEFVKTIVDYKSVAMDTNLGVIPSLPAQIEAVYNDGTTGLVDVAWALITADMVSHAGAFTVNGTVAGTSVQAKATYRVAGVAESTHLATLTGTQQVNPGQTFEVKMGMTGVTQSVYQQVYAQDLTLHYDPMKLQLDSVTSLKEGFQVIDQKEAVPGHVRIVAASVGATQPVLAQGDVLNFKFTVKSATQATNTTISVGNVVIAGAQGNELQVGGASREVQITIPSTPVDKSALNASITNAQTKYNAAVEGNGDGLYAIGSKAQLQSAIDTAKATANDSNATQQQVDSAKAALETAVQAFESRRITADVNGGGVSIGDLAIVAGAYGKQQGQTGWNEKADVNHDGKVDIEDLAIVAKAILK